jgi:S1-C subfamily serine protease
VELLTPILDELLSQGRSSAPPRPWLGVYCAENEGHVFVQRTSPGGPADKAGIRPGDRIVAVGDVEVNDLIALWRSIWARGSAGTVIPLRVSRARAMIDTAVTSSDRARFLKGPRLH